MSSILLIEPDSILGDIYKKTLTQAGHMVILSKGAQAAVQAADKVLPDIVILELQLSGHSGVEFLYEFRSYPEWQKIPVILHTLVPEESVTLPPQLGVSGHLYKPATSLKQLVRAVDELAQVRV